MTTFIFFTKSILLILFVFFVFIGILQTILVKIGGLTENKAFGIILLLFLVVVPIGKAYRHIPFPFSLEEDRAKAECIENIENKVIYQFEWTNGWFDDEFSKSIRIKQPLRDANIAPSDKKFIVSANKEGYSHQEITDYLNNKKKEDYFSKFSPPARTYIGDNIKLENKYGTWSNYVYECDYQNGKGVLDVRLTQGKL